MNNVKRVDQLKGRLKDAATLLLVQGRFLHGAPNHSGGFGDCPVPVCKYAREFSPAADLDLVEVFAEKEKCWLDMITALERQLEEAKTEIERLRLLVVEERLVGFGDGQKYSDDELDKLRSKNAAMEEAITVAYKYIQGHKPGPTVEEVQKILYREMEAMGRVGVAREALPSEGDDGGTSDL